jgi:hypothetical protein
MHMNQKSPNHLMGTPAASTDRTTFQNLFNDAVDSLIKAHAGVLSDPDTVDSIRRRLRAQWTTTGDAQNDNDAMRAAVEKEIDSVTLNATDQLTTYRFELFVDVHNVNALYVAALNKLIASGIEPAEAEGFFRKNGIVDAAACLVQVLDPGQSPEGLSILGSSACLDGKPTPDLVN